MIPTVGGSVKIDGRTIRASNGTLVIGEVPVGNISGSGASTGDVLTWDGSAWGPDASSGSASYTIDGGDEELGGWGGLTADGGDEPTTWPFYAVLDGGDLG